VLVPPHDDDQEGADRCFIHPSQTGMEAAVRYSLKALAAQQWTPAAAKELVENVAHRLHVQSEACAGLLADLPRHRHGTSKSPSDFRDAERNVRHLLHVHRDTLAQCLQVSNHPRLFLRWSGPDRHDVAALAEEIRTRHAPGLERWVDYSLFAHGDNDNDDDDAALDAILRRRWSVQLLCDQLVKLPKGRNAVSVSCDVSMAVQEAYTEAAALCDAHWQRSPDLELVVPDSGVGPASNSEYGIGTPDNAAAGARATVIRPWLHHALVELCKNAMHATVQRQVHEAESRREAGAAALPPPLPPITIRVVFADDPTMGQVVMIHVEDRGVGLGKDGLSSVVPWAFQIGTSSASSASSSSSKWDRLNVQQSYAPVRSPLNSLGVGLPVSRMMMRHVGGDVALRPRTDDAGGLNSTPGCVATITLPLDTTILEPSVCIAG
jgi:hypothetical protein